MASSVIAGVEGFGQKLLIRYGLHLLRRGGRDWIQGQFWNHWYG